MFGIFKIGKQITQLVDFLQSIAVVIAGLSSKVADLTKEIKDLKQEIESLKQTKP